MVTNLGWGLNSVPGQDSPQLSPQLSVKVCSICSLYRQSVDNFN